MIVYKNGMKMRVVDKEMQKVIQAMCRNGIYAINMVREGDGVSVFVTETLEKEMLEMKGKKYEQNRESIGNR